jgi:hypothetical protein
MYTAVLLLYRITELSAYNLGVCDWDGVSLAFVVHNCISMTRTPMWLCPSLF